MALCCSANNLALSSRERVGLTPGCSILTATALTGPREMNTVIKEAEEVQLQLMITVEDCVCVSEPTPIGGVGVLVPWAGLDIKIAVHGDTLNAGTLILLMAQYHTAAAEWHYFNL